MTATSSVTVPRSRKRPVRGDEESAASAVIGGRGEGRGKRPRADLSLPAGNPSAPLTSPHAGVSRQAQRATSGAALSSPALRYTQGHGCRRAQGPRSAPSAVSPPAAPLSPSTKR
ncbi:hypothetical protein NDU88_000933 [Pleurodeles waltl]|uniref:Uncharacterized protein n=1 Tax=Pleurodeles waltl TaxID=8319 RepID=A0AAV7U5U7_PLEWA|nr:hypothetical protein NDU88_000933 [Pleurodeles waltl]